MTTDGSGLPRSARRPGDTSEEEVRAELERILGHRDFEATERTRTLLRFVVEETLAGRHQRLKGYTIAVEVFDRAKAFDANRDPIARIQAGRLRRALEHYYLVAGRTDPIRIDIPKGSYVPTFAVQATRADQPNGMASAAAGKPLGPGPTIAIMPFRIDPQDPEQVSLADGLVDELLNELGRYEDAICVSCRERPSAESGGARFLLSGSVRRDPSLAKVSLQLTDTTSGQQIWSDSDGVALDPATLIGSQEDIARRAAAAIAGVYGVVARRLFEESSNQPLPEISGYQALLRYHHYMLVMTPEAAAVAFAALQATTQREPGYGPAWAGLANLYCHAVVFDLPGFDAPLDTALAHARRAAALSPDSQLAQTIMAYVCVLRDEFDLFRTQAEVALALNPNAPNYVGTIGYLHALAGDLDRGCKLIEWSIAQNPHHPKWFHHGLCVRHLARRNYEAAYREALMVGHPPGFWDPALRAATLAKLGRMEEARAAGRELLAMKPDVGSRIRGLLHHTLKLPDVAEDFLDGLRTAGLQIP